MVLRNSTGLTLKNAGSGASLSASNTVAISVSVPAQFSPAGWAVADLGTGGDVRLTLVALPSDGGSSLTGVEYDVDGSGAWVSLSGVALGDYDLSGFTDGQPVNIRVRAVNSQGQGPASASKPVTPTLSTGSVPSSFSATSWDVVDSGAGVDAAIKVYELPPDNGDPITDLQVQVGAGAWASLSGEGKGVYSLATSSDGLSSSVSLRAINASGPSAGAVAKSVTTTTAANKPGVFLPGDWSISDSQHGGEAAITIANLPSSVEQILEIQARVDGGVWQELEGVETGTYSLRGRFTDGQQASVDVRAVNWFGAGTASASKTVTTSDAFTGTPTVVSDNSSFQSAIAAAVAGSVILIASSVAAGDFSANNRNVPAPGVKISAQAGAVVQQMSLDNVDGAWIDAVNFEWDNRAGTDFVGGPSNYALNFVDCARARVSNVDMDLDPQQTDAPGTNQPIATLDKRYGGIYSIRSDGEIWGFDIRKCRDCMVHKSGAWFVHDGNISRIYEDGITGDITDWVVKDVYGTLFEGTYVRTYGVDSTANMVVGETYTKGDQVIEIETIVDGTTIHGRINNYDLPTIGIFTGPSSKTFNVTSAGGEVPGKNIHGDFWQGIQSGAGRALRCIIKRCLAGRTLGQPTTTIAQEPNSQMLLGQFNAGTFGWSPCIVIGCVSLLGNPWFQKWDGCANGVIAFCNGIWPGRQIRHRMEISQFLGPMRIENNTGDSNFGNGTIVNDQGGHTVAPTIQNNVFVDGNNGDQALAYTDLTPIHTIAKLRPILGGVLDTGNGGGISLGGFWKLFPAP